MSEAGRASTAKPLFDRSVTVLGVYQYSDAYPNTKYSIELLRRSKEISVHEISKCLFSTRPNFAQKKSLARKISGWSFFAIRAVYCHLNVFLRGCFHKSGNTLYIPYPAVGVLVLYSFLPRFWRPAKIVADAFISVYDTAVVDRQLLKPSTLAARIIKRIERRAYRTTTLTTVDTEENRSYFAALFDLPESRFVAKPLATNEDAIQFSRYRATADSCHVVFVGTFVPLQGVEVIASAIVALKNRRDIRFTILGSGQTASEFQALLGEVLPTNLNWIPQWQDSAKLAKWIHSADICLGIFGAADKAQRVWPFKNYAYMACGRAVITGDTACARRMLAADELEAFHTVPMADSQALAEKIADLADTPALRERLSHNARVYYEKHLSNELANKMLIDDILFN